jgi:hypothetical protein
MSLTKLIDDLSDNSAKLRVAMQTADISLIEEAVDAFWGSVEAMKAVGPNPNEPGLQDKLAALKPELEQARALACLLGDMTGQMHDLAASRARDARQPLYARSGERFA